MPLCLYQITLKCERLFLVSARTALSNLRNHQDRKVNLTRTRFRWWYSLSRLQRTTSWFRVYRRIWNRVFSFLHFRLHVVEGRAVLEPLDLEIIVGVIQWERIRRTIGVGGGTSNLNISWSSCQLITLRVSLQGQYFHQIFPVCTENQRDFRTKITKTYFESLNLSRTELNN